MTLPLMVLLGLLYLASDTPLSQSGRAAQDKHSFATPTPLNALDVFACPHMRPVHAFRRVRASARDPARPGGDAFLIHLNFLLALPTCLQASLVHRTPKNLACSPLL